MGVLEARCCGLNELLCVCKVNSVCWHHGENDSRFRCGTSGHGTPQISP